MRREDAEEEEVVMRVNEEEEEMEEFGAEIFEASEKFEYIVSVTFVTLLITPLSAQRLERTAYVVAPSLSVGVDHPEWLRNEQPTPSLLETSSPKRNASTTGSRCLKMRYCWRQTPQPTAKKPYTRSGCLLNWTKEQETFSRTETKPQLGMCSRKS